MTLSIRPRRPSSSSGSAPKASPEEALFAQLETVEAKGKLTVGVGTISERLSLRIGSNARKLQATLKAALAVSDSPRALFDQVRERIAKLPTDGWIQEFRTQVTDELLSNGEKWVQKREAVIGALTRIQEAPQDFEA